MTLPASETLNRRASNERSFSIVTLGCAKNRSDSEGMQALLQQRGLRESSDPGSADVVIVNTCGFLGAAREESTGVVQEFIDLKRPGQFVIAAGCLPALGDYRNDLPAGVDSILTTREWFKIGDTVGSLFGEEPQSQIAGCDGLTTSFTHTHAGPSAYVKIADGCDHACAFCTIPSIKGRQTSKRPMHVLQETIDLVARGTKEIVLVSQDTIRYGADLGVTHGLPELMKALATQVPDLPWLRVLYIYPNPNVLRMIDAMAEHDALLNYIDMPLQHSSPSVLRRMLRPSDPKLTCRLLDHARATLEDCILRTTLITGFPGETNEEFAHLLQFVEKEEFDHVGVFTYSPEPGTVAYGLGDPVPAELAEERRGLIMEAQQAISLRKNRTRIGRPMRILVEATGESVDDRGTVEPISVGRTWQNAPEVDGLVFLPGELPVGVFVDATIVDASEYDLWAEPTSPFQP
ncbi:MAG: 30S ribosomal protein S12 methylthiotransferase RimO [Thermomicrobiales bacterium]